MLGLSINASIQQGAYELAVLGTAIEFVKLADCLAGIPRGLFSLSVESSSYYPIPVSQLLLNVSLQSDGLLTAQLQEDKLTISGDITAFQQLRAFLESLQELPSNGHFHVDWLGNEGWLAPATSTTSFIFWVKPPK